MLDSDSHAGFINVPIPKRVVNPDMLDDDAVGQKHVNEVVEEAMDNVCLLLFTHRALAMRFLHHHGEPLKPTQVPNATGTALVGAKVGGQPRVGFVRARCLTTCTPMMRQLKTLHVPGPVVWRHLVNSSGGPTPGGLTTPGTALINPPVFFEDDGGEMYLHMLMGTSQVRRVGRVAACAKASGGASLTHAPASHSWSSIPWFA